MEMCNLEIHKNGDMSSGPCHEVELKDYEIGDMDNFLNILEGSRNDEWGDIRSIGKILYYSESNSSGRVIDDCDYFYFEESPSELKVLITEELMRINRIKNGLEL